MAPPLDLTLQTFGRLWALNRAPNMATGRARWVCLCECGNKVAVMSSSLRRGLTQSCGCLQAEARASTRHGHRGKGSESPTYTSWSKMRARCINPNDAKFANYGGRGITICERWDSFENFLADMGERPEGTTLDRRDNEGNYEPGNCRWATRSEQNRNRRPRPRPVQ